MASAAVAAAALVAAREDPREDAGQQCCRLPLPRRVRFAMGSEAPTNAVSAE
jgi:hypothetical protein